MVLLRDGEWFWLCICGWQSSPAAAPALVTTGHLCGSGDKPGDGTWIAAPVPFAQPSEVLVYPSRPEYQRYMEMGWFIV
jgi:hypothetical protein